MPAPRPRTATARGPVADCRGTVAFLRTTSGGFTVRGRARPAAGTNPEAQPMPDRRPTAPIREHGLPEHVGRPERGAGLTGRTGDAR
ncbi:hypothetical protein F7Q99_24865 [Streptomyces kaniharaensis]|uniref:Uncharacterized protein n=1 Tax=Streptomyces kaniharaensis TaxID=212423 RepID=A0A6N7KVD1_9ACTN|nr:hypothetical protein [Streptomyces kaniharaensis]MQS15411.1 hypothetical protein [Streptomyces kaniharaensis]